MAYWTLTKDCIYELRNNWIHYYHDRLDAIHSLANAAVEDYCNEANDDIRHERYNNRSIHEWYNDKLRDTEKWIEECVDSLKEEDAKFSKFCDKISNDTFDSRDFGYVTIYDFYRFEKRKEACYDLDSDTFRVRFTGQSHWYKIGGRRKDFEFKTSKPEFKKHQY